MNPRIHLRVYAAITVGEHVGVPRAEMLSLIQLTDEDWETERAAWSRVIADRIHDDATFMQEHDTAILEARRRIARSVEPLQSDVAAWGAFLAHWSRASDPAAWVQSLGLTWLDVAHMQAVWGPRLTADPALQRSMAELMVGEPGPMPALVIGPWPLANAFAGLEVAAAETPAATNESPDEDADERDVPLFEALPGRAPTPTVRSSQRPKS